MSARRPVVHYDLPALEMRVPEWRSNEEENRRLEPGHERVEREYALQHGEAEREEARIGGHHRHGMCAEVAESRLEEERVQLLPGEPVERLLPQLRELIAESFPESRLVGGTVVPDDHAVGIAPSHVRLRVVDRDAVAHARHRRLNELSSVRQRVGDAMERLPVIPVARSKSSSTLPAMRSRGARSSMATRSVGSPTAPSSSGITSVTLLAIRRMVQFHD